MNTSVGYGGERIDDGIRHSLEHAVTKVIDNMHDNLSEQLTVDDLARTAMLSKFHFSRVFQRLTGVSPVRFLSAIRLQNAKHLLLTTSLKVADISCGVGYTSVGTFSTRFTRSVGMSPTHYRRVGGFAEAIETEATDGCSAAVEGTVFPPADNPANMLIFMGLFPHRIPEGRPVDCTILDGPGRFRLANVPNGEWFLLVHSIAGDPRQVEQRHLMVATVGPLTTVAGVTTTSNVHLQPISTFDPPVLMALLDARKLAYDRMAGKAMTTATEAAAA